MFKHSKLAAMYVALMFTLTACGGGGGGGSNGVTGPSYSGSTSPATVDSSNAETLGKAAADAAAQTVGSEAATGSSLFSVVVDSNTSIPSVETTTLTLEIIHNALGEVQAASSAQEQNTVAGATITAADLNVEIGTNEFCGGSITVPDDVNTNGPTLDITMTFNNLCYDNGVDPQVTMNGTVRLIETDTTATVIFSNLTMSVEGGDTYTFNASTTCDAFGSNCTVDFEGSDGTTYRTGNMSVSGSDVSGYSVSGTFYHPTYGSVTLSTTTPMSFNCTGPQPDTGELAFSGDGGTSGSILFQGCSGYTFCYSDGVSPEVCDVGTW